MEKCNGCARDGACPLQRCDGPIQSLTCNSLKLFVPKMPDIIIESDRPQQRKSKETMRSLYSSYFKASGKTIANTEEARWLFAIVEN